jgi:CPA2 family monovalent cation:H+ antiporter-2
VLVVFVMSRLARLPEVRPWQLAIGLGQIGEFSFVLASIALGRTLIPTELYNAVLVAVVLTIAVSTTLARLGHRPIQTTLATS